MAYAYCCKSSVDTTLEALRLNPTHLESCPCMLEQVLNHWPVPVPAVSYNNSSVKGNPAHVNPCKGEKIQLNQNSLI